MILDRGLCPKSRFALEYKMPEAIGRAAGLPLKLTAVSLSGKLDYDRNGDVVSTGVELNADFAARRRISLDGRLTAEFRRDFGSGSGSVSDPSLYIDIGNGLSAES